MTSDSVSQGPYVQVATFCDRVLTEADGVISVIRAVDRVYHSVRGTEPPDDMPQFQFPVWYALLLKAGRARGRARVSLEFERPDTTRRVVLTQDVLFEGEERGVTFAIQTNVEFQQEGPHWLHVLVDGVELTRSPLRVVYERTQAGPAMPGQPPTPPQGPAE